MSPFSVWTRLNDALDKGDLTESEAIAIACNPAPTYGDNL